MSILENTADKDQLIEILNSMKFPIMGAGGGFAPIGTINFFDASTAPNGWLACDGSTHNISDYPDLATYYASVHGASNFYGGNGTTTFAVPDLRGEFLRGTGTNSHSGQGNGANVGVHQDGTEMPTLAADVVGNANSFIYQSSANVEPKNTDAEKVSTGRLRLGSGQEGYTDRSSSFTSRPTNTSFLICVKATVAGDPNAHHYSTEEQVVGKWLGGEDLYEKTLLTNADVTPTSGWTNCGLTYPDTFQIKDVRFCLSYMSRVDINITSTQLQLYEFGGISSTIPAGTPFTIRYTKTS